MRRALLGAAAIGLLTAQAPAPAPAPAPDLVVAQSGAVNFTAADLKRLLDRADPEVRDKLRKDPAALAQVVRSELLRRQLMDEAKAKKWDQTPDVAAKAAQARDTVIVDTYIASQTLPPADYPSQADIEQAYEANKTRFVIARQFHLAQIFFAVPPNAFKVAEDEALKRAKDARAALSKPKADFAEAAKKSDDQATAGKGGDLGFLREDSLIPAVKDAVAGLSEGQLSEPVRANDGYHLFKLLGTKPSSIAPLADAKDSIVRALRQSKQQQNEKALADDMQKRQPVQINEIELTKALPPQ